MNIHKLEAAGIDYEQGVKRFVGKAELYEQFLLKFPEDKNYVQLIENIELGNLEEAFKYAHALKGIAGNLSLNELYETLSALLEVLRFHKTENLEVLIKAVKKSYELTSTNIKKCI